MHDVLIPKPSMSTNTNQIRCQSLEDWRSWLSRAMEHKTGVWLVYPKKQADPFAEQAAPALTLEEAVQEALCWGWIDSKPGKVDARWSKLWFAPRRQGSAWSAKNKAMVAMLEAEGRMQAPGRAAVEIAKANGMWTFLDDVEAGILPDDLLAALEKHPPAKRYFDAFPKSVRRGILDWIKQAKRHETRRKRILQTAEMAQQNKRANQWPRQR